MYLVSELQERRLVAWTQRSRQYPVEPEAQDQIRNLSDSGVVDAASADGYDLGGCG